MSRFSMSFDQRYAQAMTSSRSHRSCLLMQRCGTRSDSRIRLSWSFLGFHRATRASGRLVQSASKGSAAFLWSPMSSESTLTVEEQVLRERRQYGNPNMPPLTLEVKIHPRERGGVRIDEWNRQVRHQEQRSRVLVAASETERRLEEDPEHLTRRKAASGRERILEEICRTSALGTKLTSK